MKPSERVLQQLLCPRCKSRIVRERDGFRCSESVCGAVFPVVDGVPVLIDEQSSVFSIADYMKDRVDYYPPRSSLEETVLRWSPSISWNLKSAENYEAFAALLPKTGSPTVLVIGGGVPGQGMAQILANRALDLVETDVQLAPRTQLVCDAHQLPFAGSSFDGVIAQAVLEHVLDPYRCVAEIHRVLKDGGVVYVETPFMQQVHEGRHDFTRFTHLGHRRLLREFDEISSGATGGPAMALAWSIRYLLISMAPSKRWSMAFGGLARLFFWLKYVDKLVIDKSATLDAASGYFFLGRKSGRVLPDRDLLELYRGIQ